MFFKVIGSKYYLNTETIHNSSTVGNTKVKYKREKTLLENLPLI